MNPFQKDTASHAFYDEHRGYIRPVPDARGDLFSVARWILILGAVFAGWVYLLSVSVPDPGHIL